MHWRLSFVVVLLVIAVIGWFAFGDKVSLDPILEQEDELRGYVQHHPFWSPLSGFVIYLALSLVPGTPGKSIIYGWLFGFWMALLISSSALTIAAVISFLVVRYLLREMVKGKLSKIVAFASAGSRTVYVGQLRIGSDRDSGHHVRLDHLGGNVARHDCVCARRIPIADVTNDGPRRRVEHR